MMSKHVTTVLDPIDLVAMLKEQHFLQPYCLAVFRNKPTASSTWGMSWERYSDPQLPDNLPIAAYLEVLDRADIAKRPTVLRSAEGLYFFAVPFSSTSDSSYCLVGAGVRDKGIDLAAIEILARATGRDPNQLLEVFQGYPVVTRKDVEDITDRVVRLMMSMGDETTAAIATEEVLDKLAAVVGVCSEIDKLSSCTATLSLFIDTLTILFDIPSLTVVTTAGTCNDLLLTPQWAPPTVAHKILPHRIHKLSVNGRKEKSFSLGSETIHLFAESSVIKATCFQFWSKDNDCGFVALLDMELPESDVSLIELINNRVATRLLQLLTEAQLLRANSQSQKMLSLVSSLLLIDDENHLYDALLNTATGLVGAAGGSFMTMDHTGEKLHIESALGINSHLAKSFSVKVGEGIAGKVASAGAPFLVNDIERDARIARLNRKCFTTKSFVSIPFRHKQKVIGVLNVSDKENGTAFDENDLETLTYFADHVAGMIPLAAGKNPLKNQIPLVITDELTGLYTREFLDKRAQEEISRCRRHKGVFTVMRISMKIYGCNGGNRRAMDKAMVSASAILHKTFREMDVIARYGEQSFCIMLPDTGKKEAKLVVERIKRVISGLAAADAGISSSIGTSSFPEDGSTFAQLVACADKCIAYSRSAGLLTRSPGNAFSTGLARLGAAAGNAITHDSRQLLPLYHQSSDMDNPPDAQPTLLWNTDSLSESP